MSSSAAQPYRKSCTRCKHVHCTCRGSGDGESHNGEDHPLEFDDLLQQPASEDGKGDKEGGKMDHAGGKSGETSPLRGEGGESLKEKKERELKTGDKVNPAPPRAAKLP
jgi:hypothetical protein